MRQLTPVTNLVLTVLVAAGLVLTLGLPWYGRPEKPPAEDTGGIEAVAATVARWFADAGPMVTGAEALPTARFAVMGIAGAAVVLALLMALVPLRPYVRSLLKALPMAAPVLLAVQLLNVPPGLELRWGLFVALAAGLLLANSAFHGAELRDPKPRPAPYTPQAHPGSVAPPGA